MLFLTRGGASSRTAHGAYPAPPRSKPLRTTACDPPSSILILPRTGRARNRKCGLVRLRHRAAPTQRRLTRQNVHSKCQVLGDTEMRTRAHGELLGPRSTAVS